MKTLLVIAALAVMATAAQADTVIRPNLPGGFGPDWQQRGLVIKDKGFGRHVIRREVYPGSGVGDNQTRGIVLEKNLRGQYIGRRELTPASGVSDWTDPGFTIESDSFNGNW